MSTINEHDERYAGGQKEMKVTPVLVTRGDVDLSEILKSIRSACMPNCDGDRFKNHDLIEFVNLLIWDNSKLLNLGPFGQYVAATTNPDCADLVYFQDDDCVTDPAQIVAQWEPGKIVCNMSAEYRANYEDKPDKLMGFGSCFERSLIKPTFDRLQKGATLMDCGASRGDLQALIWREPSRIFTALNRDRIKLVDVPFKHLSWATADDRLYKQPDHNMMAAQARSLVAWIEGQERAEALGFKPGPSPAKKRMGII